MPHGYPDGGHDINQSTVKLVDMAELAKRNGCISTFDRSGNVLFEDKGNNHLYPYTIHSLNQGLVYRSLSGYFVSGSAINLIIYNGGTYPCTIYLNMPASIKGSFGIEYTVMQNKYISTISHYFDVSFTFYRSHKYVTSTLRFDYLNDTVKLKTYPSGVETWVDLWTTELPPYRVIDNVRPYNVKFVGNIDGAYLSHVIINGKYIDLSSYVLGSGSSSYGDSANVSFFNTASDVSWWNLLGDIIITDNEVERLGE